MFAEDDLYGSVCDDDAAHGDPLGLLGEWLCGIYELPGVR